MEDILKEKLWFYIIHNNPDLMFTLQEEYNVLGYLNEKVNGVKSILEDMLSEGTPQYIIEEICLNVLIEDLKPKYKIALLSNYSSELENRLKNIFKIC